MRRNLLETAVVLSVLTSVALGSYELTAKSPRLLGQPLPGWHLAATAERNIPWRPRTHILPLDKALHECREAWLFYGLTTGLKNQRTALTRRVSAGLAAVPGDPAPGPDTRRTASRG